MSKTGLNEAAWEKLFKKYDIPRRIAEDGFFEITAERIKEYREPRLMAKFDRAASLPKIFSDNGLSILPVTRGSYVIGPFDAYHNFEPFDADVTKLSLPAHIQSLDPRNVTSEAVALNCAAASGVIADFIRERNLIPTVSGRMGSGDFSFRIGDTKNGSARLISVRNSQIEIDAAYEGVSSLALLEAKMDLSKDFLIRQLYYPFRTWKSRVTKIVRPIYFVYSGGIYRLYEYEFEDIEDYNSLKLVRQRNYIVK